MLPQYVYKLTVHDRHNLMLSSGQPHSPQLPPRTVGHGRTGSIEELDEEALSQVCGGQVIPRLPPGKPPTVPSSGRGRVRGR
jgi:hypothetical protein